MGCASAALLAAKSAHGGTNGCRLKRYDAEGVVVYMDLLKAWLFHRVVRLRHAWSVMKGVTGRACTRGGGRTSSE